MHGAYFRGREDIGLPYGLARRQVELIEETDRVGISTTYKVGEAPYPSPRFRGEMSRLFPRYDVPRESV